MTEEEYRALPSEEYFSASFLKMFDKEGAKCLTEKILYDNKELLKGSVIDTLAFDNNNFENIYYVSDAIKEPTDNELKLLRVLKDTLTTEDISDKDYIQHGLDIIKSQELWSNVKNKEILTKKLLNENFVKNLKSFINSKDKIVISGNDYMNALETVKNLKNNKFTKEYFSNKDISKKQVLFQIPIIFNIKDDKFKSLLDIILIDHEKKTVTAVDLKTGFDVNKSFIWSILKWRYDIQAALYTKALEFYISKHGLVDYSIENPIFIYTQVSQSDRPYPFEFSSNIVKGAFRGFTLKNGYVYKGILELVEEIKWHRETNIYNYTKKEYEDEKLLLNKNNLNIDYFNDDLPRGFFSNYDTNTGLQFIDAGRFGGITSQPEPTDGDFQRISVDHQREISHQRMVEQLHNLRNNPTRARGF